MSDAEAFVSPEHLRSRLTDVLLTLGHAELHANDSDEPSELALLLADVAKVKRTAAELYHAVETAYISCAGEKRLEVQGLGLVEVKSKKKRTDWRHEELWKDVCLVAQRADRDPVEVLWHAARPSWRVTALRELGLDPDEYAHVVEDGWSVQLPTQDLEDRW